MKSNSSTKREKSYFDVLGLCCSSEVPLIEKILKPIEGVHEVSVIVPSRTVIVVHDPMLVSQLQIVKALNQARLEANVRVKGETNYRNKWPSPFAVACGVLLLLSFLSHVFSPFKWLALAAVAVGIIPIILKSFASLRNFRIDINTLMLIAVGGSIFLKDYWEAGTIVFLFTTAEWLESRASHKATAVMSSLMNMAPQKATLASNGEEVNANEVMVSTKLAVKAGDVIPIDGIVVQGRCEVDEKALTGESFPVSKQVDSTVWAGTINLNGYISIITTVLAEDCVVAKMAKLVEEAQNNKCKTQRYIDECAKYYTPAVIVVAASLAAIPAAMKLHNLDNWYHLALVVLVSSCPCALILSTPVATYCALSKAATTGLLIKGAEYLETLSKVKTFAFDKTGTITKGEFSVSNFRSLLDDISLDKLLYWVSSIESKSSHPMAAALIDYAQSHSVEAQPDNVEEFENFPGEGIYGKIEGKNVYIGNQKIATRAGCSTDLVLKSGNENMEGKSTGYIFLGSSIAGVFYLSDSCRTGAKEALKELKSMGIKTAMLTGDCQAAANQAQIQLEGSLDVIQSSLLPEDKAKIIKDFQNDAPTAMVGDGINDAPALATADIGISMGISGSALATETGQIILMSNDIRKIPIAVRLARKTRRKIFENIFLAIFTKAAIIGLAIAGHPLVWAAVLADVGTCLVVILNSMLLLRSARKHSGSSHDHKHSHSSHKHVKCSSGKRDGGDCHKSKCSGVSKKQGCCGHDHKVHEQKNLVHEAESKQSCCAHDAHVHETKHCAHDHEDVHVVKHLVLDIGSKHNCCAHDDDEVYKVKHEAHEHENHGCCAHDGDEVKQEAHKHENHGCCAHDGDEVNEVKHEAHEHKNHGCCVHDEDEVKEEAHKHENHGCCAHDGDEVIEVKHEVHEHKNHGCCAHDDSQADEEKLPVVEHIVQVKDKARGCCDHANNETHKDGNMESQIKRSHSCEIDAKKQNDCCHEKISHKKSHSNHETHVSKDEHHHGPMQKSTLPSMS
ncbi:heavy metal atpase 4 [Artemisia annua]|uniref:Heavy metal atpase 4 n=1 Tax=Artemisia annua TaxID=35608 RepID=A0A2U1MRV1_ARTAN|nr:heavy metal atpase 4 [Artemisia annua]